MVDKKLKIKNNLYLYVSNRFRVLTGILASQIYISGQQCQAGGRAYRRCGWVLDRCLNACCFTPIHRDTFKTSFKRQ